MKRYYYYYYTYVIICINSRWGLMCRSLFHFSPDPDRRVCPDPTHEPHWHTNTPETLHHHHHQLDQVCQTAALWMEQWKTDPSCGTFTSLLINVKNGVCSVGNWSWSSWSLVSPEPSVLGCSSSRYDFSDEDAGVFADVGVVCTTRDAEAQSRVTLETMIQTQVTALSSTLIISNQ